MTDNIKYISFYALLIGLIVAGVLDYHWLIIFPAALVLALAYIFVKGSQWKQVMGKSELGTPIVFIAVVLSQIVLAAVCYGLGQLIGFLIP